MKTETDKLLSNQKVIVQKGDTVVISTGDGEIHVNRDEYDYLTVKYYEKDASLTLADLKEVIGAAVKKSDRVREMTLDAPHLITSEGMLLKCCDMPTSERRKEVPALIKIKQGDILSIHVYGDVSLSYSDDVLEVCYDIMEYKDLGGSSNVTLKQKNEITTKITTKSFRGTPIVVIKSFRTVDGAEKYLERMRPFKNKTLVNAIATKSLSNYGMVISPNSTECVISEPAKSWVVTDYVGEDDVNMVISSLTSYGLVALVDGELRFTDTWYNLLASTVPDIEIVKSIAPKVISIYKALEEAKKGDGKQGAKENADTGHELRDAKSVSDGEAKAASTAASASATDLSDPKMKGNTLSDGEVKQAEGVTKVKNTATNDGSKEGATKGEGKEGAKENAEMGHELRDNKTISDSEAKAAFTAASAPAADLSDPKMAGEAISDAEVKQATDVKKSLSQEVLVFKSLVEARAWNNPDPLKYYIDSMTFSEKRQHGARFSYIVREKSVRLPTGAHGNRRV